MEKKPKKTKAIIISIIAMLILGLFVFLVFKYKDKIFPPGSKSADFFQSLISRSNRKDLEVIDAYSNENIKKGDILKLDSYDANNNPIVSKTDNLEDYYELYGIAIEDFDIGINGKILKIENIQKISGQSLENIQSGDILKISSYDENGNPFVVKLDNLENYSEIYGISQNGSDILKINFSDSDFSQLPFGTSRLDNIGIINDLTSSKNPIKILVQAGEDIIKGDILEIVGYNSNGDPIVIKIGENEIDVGDGTNIFGVALNDIKMGDIGEIITSGSGTNGENDGKGIFGNILDGISNGINSIINGIGSLFNMNFNINNKFNPNELGETDESKLPKISASASPDKDLDIGETSEIKWESINTTACDIGNGYIEKTSGSFVTKPLSENTSYVIGCKGIEEGDIVSATVRVYIKSGKNTLPNVNISADPEEIDIGGTSTIKWESINTTACDIGNGYIEETFGSFITESLLKSKSYSVKCKDDKGNVASANVRVKVIKNDALLPSLEIEATPNNIEINGYSTISWTSVNADRCIRNDLNLTCKKNNLKINCKNIDISDKESIYECKNGENIINCEDIKNLKEVGLNDKFVVGPLTKSKSYSITCENENGSSSKDVDVYVNNQKNLRPKVTLTATPSSIKYGQSSTLTWKTENATSCKINNYKQDSLLGYECTKDGKIESCKDITELECKKDNKIVDCNSIYKLECKKNGVATNCDENLYNIDINGSILLKNLTKSSKFSITCRGENGSSSGNAYIYVEQRGQCEDGEDNDKDGKTDIEDLSCYKNFVKKYENFMPKYYESRVNFIPECMDTLDNEPLTGGIADGADKDDPDCYGSDGKYNPNIWLESGDLNLDPKTPECSDSVDNDDDKYIDKNDPECHADGDPLNDESYIAEHYSESSKITYLPQCSDFLDNDNDKFIDEEDPGCHEDGIISDKYLPTYSSESTNEKQKNFCDDFVENPIEFTDEQKDELNKLLRQFYLIASTLRTNDDISRIYNEIDQQNKFIGDVENLTKQCYTQLPSSSNFVRHGNPWYSLPDIYKNKNTGTYAYTNDNTGYSTIDWLRNNDYNITGLGFQGNGNSCEVVSGYYYGTANKDVFRNETKSILGFVYDNDSEKILSTGENCDVLNARNNYIFNPQYERWCDAEALEYLKDPNSDILKYRKGILAAGCKWKDGVDIEKAEQLLKIW